MDEILKNTEIVEENTLQNTDIIEDVVESLPETESDNVIVEEAEVSEITPTVNITHNEEEIVLENEEVSDIMSQEEYQKELFKNPAVQAQIMYNNYVNNSGRILNGSEKRVLRRKFLREAKKGRYNYLFDEEKVKAREARQKDKFEKLNKS